MDINQFEKPSANPWGMLENYTNASQKESVLVFILTKCIEAGEFVPIETKHSHPTMVKDGLLEEVDERRYKLTKKAIGLLYGYYGKPTPEGESAG